MAQDSLAEFDPARCRTFHLLGHTYDPVTATVTLSYALDDDLRFDELIRLPAGAPQPTGERALALQRVLGLLHVVAGVSYYKAAAPPEVVLSADIGPATASLLNALYTLGLGEFAYRNGLEHPVSPGFTASGDFRADPVSVTAGAGSLVPIGGGKDSIVALEIARAAAPVTLFSVGERPPIARTAQVSGLPHLIAERRISPLLLELNEAGALNGHVPVTAIVSLIAVASAILHGHDRVVMANERSASEGNLSWRGIEVNHQWSKSAAFEDALRAVLTEEIVVGIDYFSLLRATGELSIARAFAGLPAYHSAFTSCNSVFRLSGPGESWCRDCPKCRFVFLALAPFMAPAELIGIFGGDLLDQEAQIPGFMALCGFAADKPFECVGEHEESLAAFRLLADSPLWSEHTVVRHARETMLRSADSSLGAPERLLELAGPHHVPEPLLGALRERLRA
jgi:UDP-N-acetyl-alpha-D-muramoyl-L-alanyl-L-glutamate epimerase